MTAYNINHPMADEISVIDHDYAMATIGVSSELAFFRGGHWVTKVIPEFAQYAKSYSGDTRVYGWVPNEMVEDFLKNHIA